MLTGHPKGLFRLFFIEMWERLAFYTMLAVLLLYAIDTETGGLGYSKSFGNEIYGIYLAFIYFTPYIGGILADRFLGYRRSVLIGGLVFAAGFFVLTTGTTWSFPVGLAALCVGNGFFKPNISAMVGNLYEPTDPKRDSGFNIFYMGINIGALIAPFLATIMRNEVSWLSVFLVAGIGMLVGVSILLWSWKVLERADREPGSNPGDTPFADIVGKILAPAIIAGTAAYFLAEPVLGETITKLVTPSDIGFLVGAIPIIIFFARLSKGAEESEKPGLLALIPVYVAGGAFFMVLHLNGSAMTQWAKGNTDRRGDMVTAALPWFANEALPGYYDNAADDTPRPNKQTLLSIGDEESTNMFGQKRMDEETLAALTAKLPGGVVVEEITDASDDSWQKRSVEVYAAVQIETTVGGHGETEITVKVADDAEKLRTVAFVRTLEGGDRVPTYLVTPGVYDNMFASDPEELPPGEYMRTVDPVLYQSFNPLFVILFTPLVVWFFTRLRNKKVDFSTARKIVTGIVVTMLSLLVMSLAGFTSDNGATKVTWMWLMGFYAIITVGELCLSPMALSLVTKLSPKRFVGLTMGGWFFATAVGNKFSGFLGGLQGAMEPASFFLLIAGGMVVVAGGLFMVLPKLDKAIKQYGA